MTVGASKCVWNDCRRNVEGVIVPKRGDLWYGDPQTRQYFATKLR
jgi:hypothetical protein